MLRIGFRDLPKGSDAAFRLKYACETLQCMTQATVVTCQSWYARDVLQGTTKNVSRPSVDAAGGASKHV